MPKRESVQLLQLQKPVNLEALSDEAAKLEPGIHDHGALLAELVTLGVAWAPQGRGLPYSWRFTGFWSPFFLPTMKIAFHGVGVYICIYVHYVYTIYTILYETTLPWAPLKKFIALMS